jgi:hypothetical protein
MALTNERSDICAELSVNHPGANGDAMPPEAATWAAAVLVAVGTFLVAAALVPAVVSGPTNPYAAMGLVVLGLGAIAAACAVQAYGLVRRHVPAPVAIVAALVAFIPPIAPTFQPGLGDMTFVLLWMVLLALSTLLLHRSKAAWALAAATAIPVLGLLALSLAD